MIIRDTAFAISAAADGGGRAARDGISWWISESKLFTLSRLASWGGCALAVRSVIAIRATSKQTLEGQLSQDMLVESGNRYANQNLRYVC